jgi:hypothetical protein
MSLEIRRDLAFDRDKRKCDHFRLIAFSGNGGSGQGRRRAKDYCCHRGSQW